MYLHTPVIFFNDTATTEIYTLSLHDALPIYPAVGVGVGRGAGDVVQPAGERLPDLVLDGLGAGELLDRLAHVGPVLLEIGRAHVCTPVTPISRMPSSA